MSKQTAVEWLIEKIENNVHHTIRIPNDYFEQAKSMEREQIEEAYQAGDGDAYNLEETKTWAEQYYKERYGGDK
jgi:hypothetical protein